MGGQALKKKVRKVSQDVLNQIIQALKDIEEAHGDILRRYFDLGRWVKLAIDEGATYRDIEEGLRDMGFSGYSAKTLHRAHRFFKYVVENFEGDIEKCIAWLELNYRSLKLELIDLITTKKPRRTEPEIIPPSEPSEPQVVTEEEEEEAEAPSEVPSRTWIEVMDAYSTLAIPDWRRERNKSAKISGMLQEAKSEFIVRVKDQLLRKRINPDIVSIFVDILLTEVDNLVYKIERNLREILGGEL